MADRTEIKLQWALKLAAFGFEILRVLAGGKKPYGGNNWSETATRDEATIRQWFVDDPYMNYGVHGGKDFVMVDLDIKSTPDGEANGMHEFDALQAAAGFAPEDDLTDDATFQVNSANGGRHVYLRVDEMKGMKNQFPNAIDVRGYHGFVVGPGCVLDNQRVYSALTGIDDEIIVKQAPPWVDSKMFRPGERAAYSNDPIVGLDSTESIARAVQFLETTLPAVEGLEGDKHTYYVACQIKDMGVSQYKALTWKQ